MIKTKTLFILGAGASTTFDYPTSAELRNAILNQEHDLTIIDALNRHDVNPGQFSRALTRFKDKFSRSSVYSIDSFLEYRTEFMNIGKINIAAHLINCEEDRKLRDDGNNWYMFLYDRLKTSFEQFDQNNISFITFNYDRSLEQFLFEAIRSQFGKNTQECAEKMRKIPIVHLYGQLDLLPWQDKDGRGKEYSRSNNLIERLRAAPQNIKLISDDQDIDKSAEFQNAYSLIEAAERIYFLGFSFDETNLKRLKIRLMKNKALLATALGLEESKRSWVKRYFQSEVQTEIDLFEKLDSLSLLKKNLKIE